MKQFFLFSGALLFSFGAAGQFVDHSVQKSAVSDGRSEFSHQTAQQQQAIVQVNDTLHYFFNKNFYKNPAGNNTLFYVWMQPNPTTTNNGVSHCGSIFLNSSTITVNGLEGLVMRDPNSVSQAVPVKFYLHYLNSSNLPILPALDSVIAPVSTSTAGVWAGANFASPVTVTNNFAVTFKVGSQLAGDTVYLFRNQANTATSTATSGKYSDGLGVLRFNGNWQTTNNTFGTGTGHEFIVAPRVSFNFHADMAANNPTVCNNSVASFTNTTTNMNILENRQFNLNKFAAYWTPFTNTTTSFPSTDSIYSWTFTGSAPPATTAKNPSVLFNTAGSQNASLTVSYWHSAEAGYAALPARDGTAVTVFVDAASSPSINISGATSICAGQSATLTASSAGAITWINPSSSSNSVVVTPTAQSQYTVQATAGGCTAVRIVTVNVSPAPTVQINGPANVCAGQVFTLAASGAQSYLWSNTATQGTITPVVSSAGVEQFTVAGTSGVCPPSSAVITITVNALPSVSFSMPTNVVCTKATGGGTLALSGTPPGGTFSGINVVGSSFVPQNTGGAFTIQYSYTDNNGCTGNAVSTVTVMNCVGIEEKTAGPVAVFPNPAVGGVVQISNAGNANRLVVFNILGERVRSEVIAGSVHRLDLSGFPAGQYFLRLSGPDGYSATVKVVNQP